MNKNCYRVIFSQARGLFIAVAEIVKSQTKQAGQTSALTSADTVAVTVSPIHYKKLNPLNFAVIGCLGALVISLPYSGLRLIRSDKFRSRNSNRDTQPSSQL